MFNLYFLSAYKPLTKSFTLDNNGQLQKSSYPTVLNFTSHAEPCSTLNDMYEAVVKHSKLNHCMIKGKLHKDLIDEPRANATVGTDVTEFILLDLDDAPWATHEEFMAAIPDLKDVTYFVQQSSSFGFSTKKGLSCHIFIQLDATINATLIKPWLQHINLKSPAARAAITLSNSCAALHWPIDLTTCQNDKLIYIAPPVLGKGVVSKAKASERFQFVVKKHMKLSTSVFTATQIVPGALKTEARTLINEKRTLIGYDSLSRTTKWVGDTEVQSKPGLINITGVNVEEPFVRINLNGGDSWGYYHFVNDFELIRNFKGELALSTKDINPDYYRECVQNRATYNAMPTDTGDIVLAFRDVKSDKYYNGTWNESKHELNLYKASDTQRLRDYVAAHGGRSFGDNVPLWDLHFTPTSNEVYNVDKKTINTFVASPYMRASYETPKGKLGSRWPTIYKIIRSAVCGPEDTPSEEVEALFEHLLNWIAVICQYRIKAESAWLLSGIEGTGKSMLVDHILAHILGRKYALSKPAASLEDNFTAWVPTALLVFIDEIDIKSSSKSRAIVDKLKNMITSHITDARAMHTDAAQVTNHLNFIFSSNRIDPIELSATDRRYNIGIFQTTKLTMTDHEVDKLIPQELDHFAQYIMTRKADKNQAKKILDSSTRRAIIDNSRTSVDEISINLMLGQLDRLNDNCVDLNVIVEMHGADPVATTATAFMNIMKREVLLCDKHKNEPVASSQKYRARPVKKDTIQVHTKLTRDELYVIFQHCVGNMPVTPAKFTKLLGHRGINIEVVRVNDVAARGMNVIWELSREALASLVAQHIPASKLASVTDIKKARIGP